ncbi:hypothetical protein HMPREF0201_02021 [Cedecea davisae DSM 4568]|uniref:Uncharacterized protein n=1 Tax=Cedecea davisae DSM 4568 TaxID=566551 RepID=S3JWB4_9ENTR|nr:hypothetical protein HMPREF0201_02021 [Cedecea davisae DSM 4568]
MTDTLFIYQCLIIKNKKTVTRKPARVTGKPACQITFRYSF